MKRLFFFIIFCFVLCFFWKETEADGTHEGIEDPDTYRNVTEIIASNGYPVEEHTVQTDDGYLLSVIRIPHGRKSNLNGHEKEVILLIHGILGDANTWVLNFPGQSLGFILPDEGYDMWMLSTRGSDYSKKHIEYKIDQFQFWNFSFNEVGNYDIPCTIDYILKVTGKEALHIIGYSQGTTGSLIMLSDKPNYNDKVKLFIALAPVSFIGYSTSAYRPLVPFKYTLGFLNNLFTHGAFFPDNQIAKILRAKFCSTTDLELCENILFAFGGVDRTQLNKTRIDVYASRFPSTTSTKSLLHYGQLVETKTFRKYDYGRRRNLKYYHQTMKDISHPQVRSVIRFLNSRNIRSSETNRQVCDVFGERAQLLQWQNSTKEPPDYETSRITAPVALIWSSNDILGDPTDVDMLRKTLRQSTLVDDYQVPYPYNHFDYVLAENAPKLIYGHILQLLAEY